MAKRPLFAPDDAGPPWVRMVEVNFAWYSGFSQTQARRSIASLHESAHQAGFDRVLEISSKSEDPLGRRLSAFNLQLTLPDGSRVSVENAFQGSKVFSGGGPYTDLYRVTPREAKKDPRVRGGTPLVKFRYFGVDWPLQPPTLFYDWLYLTALRENGLFAEQLPSFHAFTDIAFNPERSVNCQARSAALYVALRHNVDIPKLLTNGKEFLQFISVPHSLQEDAPRGEQITLW